MFIVHVAGAPGSGKTTLGVAFERIAGVQVFDLDDVNRAFAESNNYVSLTRTDPKKFQRLYQAHIDELIDRVERTGCSVLVFVGINAAILGSWPGKRFLTVNVHATHRVALTTPTELNVQRWIQRDMPELVDELCARLKEDIKVYTPYETEERDFVRRYESDFHALLRDFRPSQRTRDIERFKNYFTKQGFLPRGGRRIEALVRALATQ